MSFSVIARTERSWSPQIFVRQHASLHTPEISLAGNPSATAARTAVMEDTLQASRSKENEGWETVDDTSECEDPSRSFALLRTLDEDTPPSLIDSTSRMGPRGPRFGVWLGGLAILEISNHHVIRCHKLNNKYVAAVPPTPAVACVLFSHSTSG